MNAKLATAVLFIGASLLIGRAFADCAGDTLDDKKRSYERARAAESAGKKDEALRAYSAAQGYACEPHNPYEADAAQRAAQLGMELGTAAEEKGDLKRAFQAFEDGGHYAIADRVFMQITRAQPDNPGAYESALAHYRNREGAFVSNNAAAIKATGGYKADPKYMAEVKAMPARGLERALQKEQAEFNQPYLREYVQLMQSRPDDVLDNEAMQRWGDSYQAFARKWQRDDFLKGSRDSLRLARTWGRNSDDESVRELAESRFTTLVEQRATTLRTAFHGAPKLLDEAMDYYRLRGSDNPDLEGELRAIRSQALQLADLANSKQRYTLAAEYYGVADDEAKAKAALAKSQQLAMQKLQPAIDETRKQAEELQKQFGDPARVEAMRRQAEAARKSLQQQRANAEKDNRRRAEDLEEELGL